VIERSFILYPQRPCHKENYKEAMFILSTFKGRPL
jgi:hypothetical protein